jgi:hypothetical protein
MAKVKVFEKVLEFIQNADGEVVTKENLIAALGPDIVENRIPTYIWEIKTKAGIPVEAIKDGRKVVGWRIASAGASPGNVQESHEEVAEEVATKDGTESI